MKLKSILRIIVKEEYTKRLVTLTEFMKILERDITKEKYEHNLHELLVVGGLQILIIARVSNTNLFLKRMIDYIVFEINDKHITLPKDKYEYRDFLEVVEKNIVMKLELPKI